MPVKFFRSFSPVCAGADAYNGRKQKTRTFSVMLNHVGNNLFHSPVLKNQKPDDRHATGLLRQNIARNTVPETVPETQTAAQIQRLHSTLAELQTTLACITPTIPPRTETIMDATTLTVALHNALQASQQHDASPGKLYETVLDEEITILASSIPHCRATLASPSLTPAETAILTKAVVEKKIAIIDFCLKVLRLHEQAAWMTSDGSDSHCFSLHTVDKLLGDTINDSASKPVFTSTRGRDPVSGLYHETQFRLSGTCALHANNHYLAAWCEREGLPFLPLTPRRLEMLLSGLQQRIITEAKELEIMAHQNNLSSGPNMEMRAPRLEINEKYILRKKNEIVEYDTVVLQDQIVNTTATATILSANVTGKINQLYGMPDQVLEGFQSFADWYQESNHLLELEQRQDSLILAFKSENKKNGHVICFNKKNSDWFLQDSHYSGPIKCRPVEFVRFIVNKEKNPLISERLNSTDYKQKNKLTEGSQVRIYHYEPKKWVTHGKLLPASASL